MASIIREGAGESVRRRAPVPIAVARLAAFELLRDDERAESLSTLIRTEIVPRLVVAHAGGTPLSTAMPPPPVSEDDVEALAAIALDGDADRLWARIDGLIGRGAPADAVLVDLLAPTARLLGEYWKADRCDFIDVTMALWRLQEAVRELAARVPPGRSSDRDHRSALFAAMPGDQHGFGTIVVDEIFRREGWLTCRLDGVATPELLRHAAADWYDLIGLTVSCDCHIGTLPSLVVALRSVSRNPGVCVMVGGRVFAAAPALAAEVGADGTGADARAALRLASALVHARRKEARACR